MSRSVASYMIKHGMKVGDKCIYLTSDITRMFAIMIGVWRAGGVVCSSYPEDTKGIYRNKLENSGKMFHLSGAFTSERVIIYFLLYQKHCRIGLWITRQSGFFVILRVSPLANLLLRKLGRLWRYLCLEMKFL